MTRVIVGVMAVASCVVEAQDPPKPHFEVASIRPHKSDDTRLGFHPSPGRYVATGVTVKLLIASAYRVQTYLISGGSN